MTTEERVIHEFKLEDTVECILARSRNDSLTIELYTELLAIAEKHFVALKAAGENIRPMEIECGYAQIEVAERQGF